MGTTNSLLEEEGRERHTKRKGKILPQEDETSGLYTEDQVLAGRGEGRCYLGLGTERWREEKGKTPSQTGTYTGQSQEARAGPHV